MMFAFATAVFAEMVSGTTDEPSSVSGGQNVAQPKTDLSTGAFTFDYPITLPAGRNGTSPNLKLAYSSRSSFTNSPFGYGWSDGIPTIERINKTGTNRLYTDNYFFSSTDGELVSHGNGVFTPKTEGGNFSKYTFSNNQWLVTDKRGTTYRFGDTTSARQDDPLDSSRVYKWMLEEVKDTNGNTISYTYYKDGGQIYPSSITYSNTSTGIGIFKVDFLREVRADNASSTLSGFPVATNYRINEIGIKVNGATTTKYALDYTAGVNGVKSLVHSIVKSGTIGGTTTTLPATTFTYQNTEPYGWTIDNSWTIPVAFTINGTPDPYQIADVNGDGLPDIFQSSSSSGNPLSSVVYLNTGHSWVQDTSWTVPVAFIVSGYRIPYRVADINGDGLPDIFNSYASSGTFTEEVYLNNGHGWTQDYSWTIPIAFIINGVAYPYEIADINGDGLPDIFNSDVANGNPIHSEVYLNNGHGWTQDSTWTVPVAFTINGVAYPYQIDDINGDGLPDIFNSDVANGSPIHSEVYLNNGHGWTQDSTWNIPLAFVINGAPVPYQIADINGDGLSDIFQSSSSSGNLLSSAVYLNTGHGWTVDSSWTVPVAFILNGIKVPYYVTDINGDGLADFFNSYSSAGTFTQEVYVNNPPASDLLTRITHPEGGSTHVAYKPVTQYTDESSNLTNKSPYSFATAFQISKDDGNGTIGTTTYRYEQGSYFFSTTTDRKFAGFGKVTETDPAGTITTTFYHQGNTSDTSHGEYQDDEWKIGQPYRKTVTDSSGNVYAKTLNKWDEADLGSGAKFVKLAQTVDATYDGDATHKDKAESYTYDSTNGNLTGKTEYGEVIGNDDGTFADTGTDDFTTAYTYATDGANLVGLPAEVSVTDHGANKVKGERYYYDTQALGSVTKGNQTKREVWKNGTDYVATEKTYDGTYGLVTSETDPNGNTTAYTYDTTKLYPVTVTNALNQSTSFLYDYASGQVTQKTDPNGRVFQSTYDGLGRV
ncbi:MAG: FG-GAP-like repeat-containing protein, partial [bacterium]|nr:FG-GAP-like repeat-containing protein [bacterium]